MANANARKPIGTMVRHADGVRVGLFATEDVAYPLLKVEEDEAGGFDLSTAERMPFAEAFSVLQQINRASRAIN